MSKTVSLLRKILVLLIGLPIVVIGVILIPLPGPGLLIVFAGLFIISLEFEWAKKYVDSIKKRIGKILTDARQRSDNLTSRYDGDEHPVADPTKKDRSKKRP